MRKNIISVQYIHVHVVHVYLFVFVVVVFVLCVCVCVCVCHGNLQLLQHLQTFPELLLDQLLPNPEKNYISENYDYRFELVI